MMRLDPELRERLRTPAIVWAALLALLLVISIVGIIIPHGNWWILEAVCLAMMVAIVIVFSMELIRHQPIVRVFSFVGFFWAAILFGLTMLDYLTR